MIYLSLGSNNGDEYENLASARRLLEENSIRIVGASSEIITKAWGIKTQPDFVNQVLQVEFSDNFDGEKSPYTLLYICQGVERELGKVMAKDDGYVKWGPRIIDIDILQYDEIEGWDPELRLPHHTIEKDYIKELIAEICSS
ncbi:MAG: 2-amino-4-hydroxy-6-hydroxymethyldihydropteridine diphosphokinase [Candidatus Peregrinibacteria bacterium]|nr:2-amino-4-hydroxy-6-hydroxymethyldihydropteridine diphosphokinase [Candidatus Peregrinibacteria bacterium]MDZ4245297.1 2-amino-4-hydroxy-6-hydroxymethyldihydropteridine diphosphokinase [Candidatus Gracilibacteria bacterium]